ncbi:hypothetical protein ACWNT8_01405 [Pigmentibacter ruber]|uniref:hypothetical protein n=1 Tax=Pigmentibacter ruber TaxID=2683196 RepID=UPI00131CE7D8|nr:hypothetical protein [Pigmentibacter ruber]BFD31009.1 hypothetical protein GTC16762_06270 [Pigmentibacter ruber]
METTIADNIIHKMNKMLLIISANCNSQLKIKPLKEDSTQVDYFLSFPLEAREEMANFLEISLKTLHRIYENPIKILDDYKVVKKMGEFFNKSYPEIICTFFNVQHSDFNDDPNISVFLKEIQLIDKELSIEARRELVRLLVLIRKMKISVHDFSIIARQMIYKKCFVDDNLNRIRNLIDNF